MLLTYYTLDALAREWHRLLPGARLADAYSQHRDELSLAFEGPGEEGCTLVIVTRPELRLLFRNRGHGRAKRNTASLFEAAIGREVTAVRTGERDRVTFIDLGDDFVLQAALFGPRPNVWLVADGRVLEAFAASGEWVGREPPATRPAPVVETFEDFAARWPGGGRLERAVARAMPLFDALLAAEVIHASGVAADHAAAATEEGQRALFAASRALEARLAAPKPRIYWRGARAEAFALAPLAHLGDLREEPFDSVDDAARIFSHRSLGQERFDARYRPLEKKLRAAATRLARSAERMLEELGRESRAETYERFGHLLMASATKLPAGHEEVEVPDLLADGAPVAIALDPALTGVENAERFYDRARRTRASRAHAEARWEEVHARSERAQALLAGLHACETLKDLEHFEEQHAEALAALAGSASGDDEREPFRRFPLPGGLEAWVGRNARSNAELTTRHARPHDLWLHARGVPGSHVVIRRASREAVVPGAAVEAAARLAAYFSRAKTSGLVPVIVTERKFVRPIKGGPAGAVRVDREEVLLVEPRQPGE